MQPVVLTQEIIDELKKTHPVLYRIKLGSQDFIFRPLTRYQWQQIQELVRRNPSMTPNDVDDRIVEYGLVWPQWTIVDFMNMPAGYTTQLSRFIQARSGFLVAGLNDTLPEVEVLVQQHAEWPAPTDEQIAAWRREYPQGLLRIRVGRLEFIARPLLRAEWRAIAKQVDSGSLDVDSAVFERAIIYPSAQALQAIDSLPGIVTLVSNEVVRFSGFDDTEEVVVEEL